MRTHRQIVQDYGAARLCRDLVEKGFRISGTSTVQRWADRDSIPGEYWKALGELDAATYDDLADAADAATRGEGGLAA